MTIARKTGLACAFVCMSGIAFAQPQSPRTLHLSTSGCATEGGEITVQADGATILAWKGDFCVSTGCTIYEISDIADDGSLTLKADKSYVDGGELSYVTTVYRGAPDWEHDAAMNMDHGAFLKADLRSVQAMFELSMRAVKDGKTELQCN